MGMLRRMCGVTKLDMIRNERIRGQRNRKVTPGKDVEVTWHMMRRELCEMWLMDCGGATLTGVDSTWSVVERGSRA